MARQPSPVINWCFTLNNYTDDDIAELNTADLTKIRFILVGAEVGKEGTPHLQGYMQLIKKARLTAVKKYFRCFARAHLEACKGTQEDNIKYVSKEGRIVVNLGNPTREASLDAFRDAINKCSTWSEVLDLPQAPKHLQYARECWANRKPIPMEGVKLRDWQQVLYDELKRPADDRTIIWVYDPKGGKGKTFFAKYMMSNHNAFYCSPGRQADILCLYDNQPIILYDIPRCVDEEYINYGVLEKIKDGICFSGKYTPITKVRQCNAHVVVFSNHLCEEGKFSEDRIKLMDLTKVIPIVRSETPKPAEPAEEQPPTGGADEVGGGSALAEASGAPPAPAGVQPDRAGGAPEAVAPNNNKFILTFDDDGWFCEESTSSTADPQDKAVSVSITRNCGTMALSGVK